MFKDRKRIAILGGGPSGLFMFKRLVDANCTHFEIDIFEKKKQLGAGMPYSHEGANDEHVTNVSGNEIPELVTPLADWIKTVHRDTLHKFHIDPAKFNDYKVLPRLLFGQYLETQFTLLQQKAKEAGISFNIRYNSNISDVTDDAEKGTVGVKIASGETFVYDQVIICTGHNWPLKHERTIPGYFDSPYPPQKIALKVNHAVAIRGASLTAVDAIRTLARHNGAYSKNTAGKLTYQLAAGSAGFKLVLHSRNGLLPAVRFHLEDSHLQNNALLTKPEIDAHIQANDGFLSLDFIFEQDFKLIFKEKDPEFYESIKEMRMEEFVEAMMALRESADPFELMKAEYAEAERSIKEKRSVYWKEMLGVLSFAMNYPAKHFSAEDMQRLQKTLMPLISIVIAYIPQSSCEEIFALHDAGLLELVTVGEDSYIEPVEKGGAIYHYTNDGGKPLSTYYNIYIDCTGQPHLDYQDFPYPGLMQNHTISSAKITFKDAAKGQAEIDKGNDDVNADSNGNYYLNVPGITINDCFQPVDSYGALNERLYMMAVPYMVGYNPDYSGLDFCEKASETIINSMLKIEVE
ncbi:FAD/NAD(P)-binding protein [Mucilaginibacter phyllosphaerae]|uniref:NAD(P)/FAD-binding protein YdhS n=1 Tax=Mucilaginibacter phyllosphaerae TaxID=1812349 RepID=A0A4Y8AK68_9SPHI|nr:FAD/NAD(P)-binding protein [Mucilaginibacter phyllosphaerae]MBB3967522.1 putative NAD(P)/FAD-binding protein YdhS [Mucilaginibacter phyllosphaerae]TEW69416.1 hypothetical protein E2R65_04405 [Mucilaginibacter phyllosphaerae]